MGLRVLGRDGPAGLSVEALCGAAGKTRGSLYHHFPDHGALLVGVLEHWRAVYTDALIAEVRRQAGGGSQLSGLALGLDFAVERGVRQLVARRPELEALVGEVDSLRLAFLIEVHRPDHGDRAEGVATVEYAAFLGFQQLLPARTPTELEGLYAQFQRMLTGPGPRSPIPGQAESA